MEYDAEFLAVMKKTEGWTSASRGRVNCYDIPKPTDGEVAAMEERVRERNGGTLKVSPDLFLQLEPGPRDTGGRTDRRMWKKGGGGNASKGNPQTDYVLDLIGSPHVVTVPWGGGGGEGEAKGGEAKEVRGRQGAKQRAGSYFRTRHASFLTKAIFLIPRPNHFGIRFAHRRLDLRRNR